MTRKAKVGARKGPARRAAPGADPFVHARERLYTEVQANLARAMEEADVSRSELARRLGVDRAHVTRLLQGERAMRLATVAEAFAACGYAAHLTFDAEPDRVEVVMQPPRPGVGERRAAQTIRAQKTVLRDTPKLRADGPLRAVQSPRRLTTLNDDGSVTHTKLAADGTVLREWRVYPDGKPRTAGVRRRAKGG